MDAPGETAKSPAPVRPGDGRQSTDFIMNFLGPTGRNSDEGGGASRPQKLCTQCSPLPAEKERAFVTFPPFFRRKEAFHEKENEFTEKGKKRKGRERETRNLGVDRSKREESDGRLAFCWMTLPSFLILLEGYKRSE